MNKTVVLIGAVVFLALIGLVATRSYRQTMQQKATSQTYQESTTSASPSASSVPIVSSGDIDKEVDAIEKELKDTSADDFGPSQLQNTEVGL